MKTFIGDFGNGVTCTLQVNDTAPPKGGNHIVDLQWSERPTKKLLHPYIAWMNGINQQLANEWGIKIMQVFMLSEKENVAWEYLPGQQPKRVAL